MQALRVKIVTMVIAILAGSNFMFTTAPYDKKIQGKQQHIIRAILGIKFETENKTNRKHTQEITRC